MNGHEKQNFYKQLLDETVVEVKDSEKVLNHKELRHYFLKRSERMNAQLPVDQSGLVESYKKNGMLAFSGRYSEKNRCFRLDIPGGILDFPTNWDIFTGPPCAGETRLSIVDAARDSGNLLDVMRPFASYDSDLLFLFCGNEFQLIFIPQGNDTVYKKLQEYTCTLKAG